MKEQNEQQRKKFNDIKVRTAAIRQRYEEQQRRSVIGLGGLQSPNSYAQGITNYYLNIISKHICLLSFCHIIH